MSPQECVFGALPMNVLVQASKRRTQPADPAEGETILVERRLLDDLVHIVEQALKLHLADESLRRRNIQITGGKNHFTCKMDYLTEEGGEFVKVQGEGSSALGAFLNAAAGFHAKLADMVR